MRISFQIQHDRMGYLKFPVKKLQEMDIDVTPIDQSPNKVHWVYELSLEVNDDEDPLTVAYSIGKLVHSLTLQQTY